MNHADPWDEITRLERQMEVESLALNERSADEALRRDTLRARRGSNRGPTGPLDGPESLPPRN